MLTMLFTASSCRFQLSFHAASDEGVFPVEVLEARLAREAESLAGWQRTAAGFGDFADLHAWLHDQHLCYAVRRQVRPSSMKYISGLRTKALLLRSNKCRPGNLQKHPLDGVVRAGHAKFNNHVVHSLCGASLTAALRSGGVVTGVRAWVLWLAMWIVLPRRVQS